MNKQQSFGELFARHQQELLRSLISKFRKQPQDAEEIVQDVFHNVLKIDDFESIENPRAYLFQAANNLALNRIRKQKHHQQYLDAQDVDETDEVTPERNVLASKNLEQVKEALEKLPAKYRRTFLLSRVEQMSYREISQTLNMPESTVEKHIIKVLKFLRECTANDYKREPKR